jgi:hypothetical protein
MIRTAFSLLLGVCTTVGVAWAFACQPEPRPAGGWREQPPGRWGKYFTAVRDSSATFQCAYVDLHPGRVNIRWTICPMCGNGMEWFKNFAEGEFAQVSSWSTFMQSHATDDVNLVGEERAAGWPLLAVRSCNTYSSFPRPSALTESFGEITLPSWLGNRDGAPHTVPICPIWPGFAINTLFYAAIVWLLFAAPFALRRRRRIKRGLCPACAYPVGESAVCTECGKAVAKHKTQVPKAEMA